jgi:hypothetical protein
MYGLKPIPFMGLKPSIIVAGMYGLKLAPFRG